MNYGRKRIPGTVDESEYVFRDITFGLPISGSSVFNASFTADRAIDDNESTRWSTLSSTAPHWLRIDFGIQQPIFQYSILATIAGESPRIWFIQGSNDDSNWTNIDERNVPTTVFSTGTIFSIPEDNIAAYRYYRLYIVAPNNYSSIFELQMSG